MYDVWVCEPDYIAKLFFYLLSKLELLVDNRSEGIKYLAVPSIRRYSSLRPSQANGPCILSKLKENIFRD